MSSEDEQGSTLDTRPRIIEPATYPVIKDGEHIQLDSEQHEANKEAVRRTSYRALEILAELEMADGKITTKKGNFASEIRRRAGSEIANDSYIRILKPLQVVGIVEVTEDNKSLLLTPKGTELIALLKAYPDLHKSESTQKITASHFLCWIFCLVQVHRDM